MFKASTALAAAALLGLSFGATAAPPVRTVTLTTGVMHVSLASGAVHWCSALNVSSGSLPVTIELMDANGQVASTSSVTLNPGQNWSLANGSWSSMHCRVTVEGPASAVRASICNWQNYSCVSFLEAR